MQRIIWESFKKALQKTYVKIMQERKMLNNRNGLCVDLKNNSPCQRSSYERNKQHLKKEVFDALYLKINNYFVCDL